MNKAIKEFKLTELFKKVQEKHPEIKDISQSLDSNDKSIVVLCRTPGDAGMFEEPHNVSISKNVLKPETVKVFCDEYLTTLEDKDVEIMEMPEGNVFNLAIVTDKPEVKQIPMSKEIPVQVPANKKGNKKDIGSTKDAEKLVDSLINGKVLLSQEDDE
jgi:hypothetical protein